MAGLTVREIIDRATRKADDQIPDAVGIDLVNDCLDDLSEVARYYQEAQTTVVPGLDIYSLPDDTVEIIELMLDDERLQDVRSMVRYAPTDDLPGTVHSEKDWPFNFLGYVRFGDRVVLYRPAPKGSGTLHLKYYGLLPHVSSVEDTPVGLPAQYHGIIPSYIAMVWRQGERDELAEKRDFEAEYLSGKEQLDAYTSRFAIRLQPRRARPRQLWI